jgi:hypothetical protein
MQLFSARPWMWFKLSNRAEKGQSLASLYHTNRPQRMKRAGTYNNGGPQGNNFGAKKARSYEDEGPSFEDELGLMDEQMEFEVIEGVEFESNSGESQEGRWSRGKHGYDPAEPLAFHWLDIDTVSGQPLDSNPDGTDVIGSTEGPVPVIRMYGVTAQGQSVMANVHGFTPYFYISFPGSFELTDAVLGQLRATLDQKVHIPFMRLLLPRSNLTICLFSLSLRACSVAKRPAEKRRIFRSSCWAWSARSPCRACWGTTSTSSRSLSR